jgi:hypothetical protein
MRELRQTPTAHHLKPSMFILKDLYTCFHVFLRTDVVKSLLQPPYTGPYQVVKRLNDFLFAVRIEGKQITILTERLNPAYIAKEDSSYEQQSSHPPRAYPGKQKFICFANDHRDNRDSVTGVTGEGVDVAAPTVLNAPAAGQRIRRTAETP